MEPDAIEPAGQHLDRLKGPHGAYSPSIVAKALELYHETGSSRQAAQRLAETLGMAAPSDRTILQWASQDEYSQIAAEQRRNLSERWTHVANIYLDNVERSAPETKGENSVVPAAIATDKVAKLAEIATGANRQDAKPTTIIIIQ